MSFSLIEELWFGDFEDEAAEQAAATSMVAMVAEISGLRVFPVAAGQLLSAVRNPSFQIIELVEIIERDPSLASRILRQVNSPAFGLRCRVASVRQAVTLLGTRSISEVATGLLVLQMFAGATGLPGKIRDHSASVAALSRFLALQCGTMADWVFTCGLLHDIGKLLLLQVRDGEYRTLVANAPDEQDATFLLERATLGYDHAILGGHVLVGWGLPDPVPRVVSRHHHLARAIEEDRELARLVSIVRLGNRLSYELARPEWADDELIAALCQDPAAQHLNLTADKLATFWDELHVIFLAASENNACPDSARHPAPNRSVSADRSRAGDTACALCGQSARAMACCPRCQRPLCDEHQLPKHLRCRFCEDDFVALQATTLGTAKAARSWWKIWAASVLGLLLVVVFALQVPHLGWLALLLGVGMLPVLAIPLIIRHQKSSLRSHFLAEKLHPPVPS